MARNFFLALLVLGQLCYLDAVTSSPKVQVYSRHPTDSDKENFLNCFVSGFHPPQITIELLKDGKKIENVEESDLSFSNDWTFNRLVSTPFNPNDGRDYACRVTHSTLQGPKVVKWDAENN